MQINNCQIKTKCDVFGCKNMAQYSLNNKNEKKSCLNICESCANSLYNAIGTIVVPQSIPSPYKTQRKIGAKK